MAVSGGYTCYATYYQLAHLLKTQEQQGAFWVALNEYLFADADMEDELDTETAAVFICAKAHARTSLERAEAGKKKAKQSKSQAKRSKTQSKGNQNEAILRLSSSSRLNNGGVSASFEAENAPICSECNRTAYRNQQMGAWVCPVCNRRLA